MLAGVNRVDKASYNPPLLDQCSQAGKETKDRQGGNANVEQDGSNWLGRSRLTWPMQ